MSFTDLINQMTEILSDGVIRDFKNADKMMIEIFDNRQAEHVNHGSIGKMALPILIQKFR
jgi:hypothetical protein